MKYKTFIKQFNNQVFLMDYHRQLNLAIEVCKTLYFEYVVFTEKYQWGDKNVLLEAIKMLEQSKVWEINQSTILQSLHLVDTVTPDMDDFGSDEVASYALNACVAVLNALQFLSDKLPQHIFDIGICLTDTIDFKIQENRILSEQEIDDHPLMIKTREYLIEKSR
jgi:uncharacterized protein YjaG (DUF416 family)